MYEINSFISHHDCECCGNYSCEDVSLSDGEKEIYKFEYESHFGGGNWDGDWQSIYAFIIKDLGYKAVFTASLAECLEIIEVKDDCNYYEYYKDEDLTPLDVQVIYKRNYYKDGFYDLPFSFTFSIMKEVHTVETDEYKKFYEHCAKMMTTVHENYEIESDLDDGTYDDD